MAISANHTIFCAGHETDQWGFEVSIPAPRIAGSLSGLLSSVKVQPTPTGEAVDVYSGQFYTSNATYNHGDVITGGLLCRADGALIMCQYVYYDAGYLSLATHLLSSQTFSTLPLSPTPTWTGIQVPEVAYQPGTGGFTGNGMCHIPTEWQAALGGTAIATGQGLSISSRTSEGPSATVFNAEDIGVLNPVPGRRLLGYPAGHRTLEGLNIWNNAGGEMGGCMIVPGTRTLLYFGTYGAGPGQLITSSPHNPAAVGTRTDYGQGTTSGSIDGGPGLAGTEKSFKLLPDGSYAIDYYVYDPAKLNKGYHQYPYVPRAWAYDLNDLVATKNDPVGHPYWDTLPYAYWEVTQTPNGANLPFETLGRAIYGATYEPSTRTVYISSQSTDGGYPTIHCFSHPDFT